MQAIPIAMITCSDGTADYRVGVNTNSAAADKVQAFVDCFKSVAQYVSTNCSDLPVILILAQWGGESGWATGTTQKHNQNWSNLGYTNSNNPPGNIGTGIQGWAKFEGLNKYALGYARFFHQDLNPRYSDLMSYLAFCKQKGTAPSDTGCARYIADAGFGGTDHDDYYNKLCSWIDTIRRHTTDFRIG